MHKIYFGKLEWQHEYFAVSVTESILNKVRESIYKKQEAHYSKNILAGI